MSEPTAVATVTPNAVAPTEQHYNPLQGAGINIWTSVDVTNDAGKIAVLAAIQGAHDPKRVGDAVGQTLAVEHIVIHTVEFADEDGVLIDADRIVFIAPDGTQHATVSLGAKRSLQAVVGMYGLPPYRPPLTLAVSMKRTRKGFQTLILQPVVASTAERKTK